MSQPLTDIDFASFNLHPDLLSGLHATGFVRCTPIQALCLPIALSGRDVAGQAQTGTGKTAAFLVAVLNRLLTEPARTDRKLTDPRAVIVAPTRELAIQIDKDFHSIGRNTGLTSALIYGGVDYDKQRDALRAGCDLIIATPGRLIDYLKQHVFTLNAVEAVVIDEADRMFDLGFIKDIRFLLRRMPPREERQGMLFSATLSYRVLELAYEHMNSPEKVTAETESVTASQVRQSVYFPAREEKIPLLINMMSKIEAQRSMVFVNTRAAAERVTHALDRHGFTVGALSGDVPQTKREKLLGRFQKGDIEILVATDVAARGLHVPSVSHVFNFDLPQDAEDYVHRIGRTARLGAEGDAISFACDRYAVSLPDIEAFIEQKIPVQHIEADMLVAPPRRERAGRPSNAEMDQEDATDAARNTAGPPPKSAPPRSRAPRSGDRKQAPSRSPAHTHDPAKADSATPTMDKSAATDESPPATTAISDADKPASSEAPRKRRRRRGGRGRGAKAGNAAGQAVGNSDSDAQAETANDAAPARKPRKPRPRTRPTTPTSVNSAGRSTPNAARESGTRQEPASAPSTPVKPGLFQRIGRMFARH